MESFEKGIENHISDEKALETHFNDEINIVTEDLKNRDWEKVYDKLCQSDLNDLSTVDKMPFEAREKFRKLIIVAEIVFDAEKETIDKGLVGPIQDALNKLTEKFQTIKNVI